MRLALAQINSVVGDVDGNAAKVVEWLERARGEGADLVLFPELVVTGYPPEDLLLRPGFIRAARRAVEGIAKATHGVTAMVGAPHLDTDLFNACFVLGHGEIRCVYRKRYLPNYGVFDEDRYFAPGYDNFLLRFGDVLVGPTICEDIWVPGPPATDLALAGAQLIANISASPFHVGKDREREEMLKVRATDNSCFVALCNSVGGHDELVFDGHSVVLDDEGQVLARAAGLVLRRAASGCATGRRVDPGRLPGDRGRADGRGLQRFACRGVHRPRERPDRGELAGARARHAADGALEQVRVARDRDGQQIGAVRRVLDAPRRPRRRLCADQGRLQDGRLPALEVVERARRTRADPSVDHRPRAERRAARRPAGRGLIAALPEAGQGARGVRRARPLARGAVAGRLRLRRRRPRARDDRPRRVQAPPGAARREAAAEGLRPRPPHAHYQPLARLATATFARSGLSQAFHPGLTTVKRVSQWSLVLNRRCAAARRRGGAARGSASNSASRRSRASASSPARAPRGSLLAGAGRGRSCGSTTRRRGRGRPRPSSRRRSGMPCRAATRVRPGRRP